VIELSWETVRLFLHVLAATVWVGGQLTLAALVPALRAVAPDAPRAAAQAYNRVAWWAFGILLLTGTWNTAAEAGGTTGGYQVALALKLTAVVVSGGAAYLHTRAATPRGRGMYGGLSALGAVAALLVGVVLAG
jgi:putative copper export protein